MHYYESFNPVSFFQQYSIYEEPQLVRTTSNLPEKITVLLQTLPDLEKECIQGIPIPYNENSEILFTDLFEDLKTRGFVYESGILFYQNARNSMYMYCGKDPMSTNFAIPLSNLSYMDDELVINIRIKPFYKQSTEERSRYLVSDPLLRSLPEKNYQDILEDLAREIKFEVPLNEEAFEIDSEESEHPERRTRHKERLIGEVMELVVRWRNLHHGIVDPKTGVFIKRSLIDAAKIIGVPKKSLDDYMLVIKHARSLGYDFDSNRSERFGVLRAFVKNEKSSLKSSKGKGKKSEMLGASKKIQKF